ncbi:hypothetical protein K443DRAFT_3660 [Laccaria amethystina LaAM-08-1]|uniref:Integrase zinc-binding domain-containing protein n=1 Tax=Laccaria amethystina LaAM-08-1 TaxID=1095629 RepID=A0A0C9Y620_9AGAR|nr:hypothetical protein K443DRAFT_3660 [Laccaria amethystina LaAM-08-1]
MSACCHSELARATTQGWPVETLFQSAHDTLGHFGIDKTYGSLRQWYYWLNMRQDLEAGYVASCPEC